MEKRTEQQLDLIEAKEKNPNWGGARKGAGRKSKAGTSVVMRVPEHYKRTIQELLAFLEANADQTSFDPKAISEPVFQRSRKTDRKQYVTFSVETKR